MMLAQHQHCNQNFAVRPGSRATGPGVIEIADYQSTDAGEWKRFLESSNNGTLFHDQDFLAYHGPTRVVFKHLMFRREGRTVALLPGGLVEAADGSTAYASPCGASIGGLVLSRGIGIGATRQIVARLKRLALECSWGAVDLRIGPSLYLHDEDDQLSFCLSAEGFQLQRRWLTHAVPLPADPIAAQAQLPKRKREYIRSAERKGATVHEADLGQLEPFYCVLASNRARHGAKPTHTLAELQSLARLVPGAMRLFLCTFGAKVIAGTLVFELNPRVAYSFYPCHDDAFAELRPALLVALRVMEHYAGRGFRYLDLGPSTFDDYAINEGLAAFKEDLGARGYCRDSWRWSVGQFDLSVADRESAIQSVDSEGAICE